MISYTEFLNFSLVDKLGQASFVVHEKNRVAFLERGHKITVVGRSVLTDESNQGERLTLRCLPQLERCIRYYSGVLMEAFSTHFFVDEPSQVARYRLSDGMLEGVIKSDRQQAKRFVVSPTEVVIASVGTVSLWTLDEKGGKKERTWRVAAKELSQLIDVKKAKDVVALVQATGGLVLKQQHSHCILYFHPDRDDPVCRQECSTPSLYVIDSTFMRISSGGDRDGQFQFKHRNMAPYNSHNDRFPDEQWTDAAPMGKRFHAGTSPNSAPIEYKATIEQSNGPHLVIHYKPVTISQPTLAGRLLAYNMGVRRHSPSMDRRFQTQLGMVVRLVEGGLLSFLRDHATLFSIDHLTEKGSPTPLGDWTVDCANTGPDVTQCRILDGGVNEEQVVFLLNYRAANNKEGYCLYTLPRKETSKREERPRSPIVADSQEGIDSWVQESVEQVGDVGASEEPTPSKAGAQVATVVVVLATLVIAYAVIRVWKTKGSVADPSIPKPLPGPPIRKPRGKILEKG